MDVVVVAIFRPTPHRQSTSLPFDVRRFIQRRSFILVGPGGVDLSQRHICCKQIYTNVFGTRFRPRLQLSTHTNTHAHLRTDTPTIYGRLRLCPSKDVLGNDNIYGILYLTMYYLNAEKLDHSMKHSSSEFRDILQ